MRAGPSGLGRCGKTGHNVIACQEAEETSGEDEVLILLCHDCLIHLGDRGKVAGRSEWRVVCEPRYYLSYKSTYELLHQSRSSQSLTYNHALLQMYR